MNNQPIIDTTTKQDEYIEVLKKYFPSVISRLEDGSYSVDGHQLQLMIEPKNSSLKEDGYGLKWVGKKEAYHNAYIPNTKILKPLLEDSKNFETTGNVLIKGDNLDVLKLLRKNYFEQIKMIYIDPPYNTESDEFIYNDNFTKSQEDVLEELGYSAEQKEYIKNIAGAKTHSGWLSFMYPRLLLARDLLKDDGVIFISIDDNEQANLKLLCDEVFGQENFVGEITIQTNKGGQDYLQLAKTHEYLICYQKSELAELGLLKKTDLSSFRYIDKAGKFEIRELRNRNPKFNSSNRPNLFYPIYVNSLINDKNDFCPISLLKQNGYDIEVYPLNSEGQESCWRWGTSLLSTNIIEGSTEDSQVVAKQRQDGGWNIYEKNRKMLTKAKTIWDETEVRTERGTIRLRELFKANYFNHPKPVELILKSLNLGSSNDCLILDFFAGSGTTGEAVMTLNAEDNGKRKFILVQLAEAIDFKKNKLAYKFVDEYLKKEPTIFEITAERLRRAGEQIIADNNASTEPKDLSNLDVGFKVYEITNDQYNAIYDKKFNKISQAELGLAIKDEVKECSLTLLTNLLLGSGITFDTNVEVIISDTLYRVKDKLFILKEFELKSELFDGIEYIIVYARHFTDDSFMANLTSFVNKEKIIIKG